MTHPQHDHAREAALADLGVFALRTNDLDRLLHEACVQVARGLRVPMAKLAIRRPGSQELILQAVVGVSSKQAQPGLTILPGGKGSAMGYALTTGAPVVSQIASETRFEPSELVRRSGVKVSANVVLWVNGEAYGSLEADSRDEWEVSAEDVSFLQSYANLVAAAVERNLLGTKLQALANERQVLLNEIFHRIKNMLTNVDAIARRTVRHSRTLEEFLTAFTGRVGALSRAHDLLLVAPERPALLRELMALEFEAKGLKEGRNFRLSGGDIVCSPRKIQALALLIFELSTNAMKYGALSEQAKGSGCIDVSWRIDHACKKRAIVLNWRETGVRVTPRQERKGFGSELIEKIVPQMLDGTTQLHLRDDGIECIVTFPLSEELEVSAVPLHARFDA